MNHVEEWKICSESPYSLGTINLTHTQALKTEQKRNHVIKLNVGSTTRDQKNYQSQHVSNKVDYFQNIWGTPDHNIGTKSRECKLVLIGEKAFSQPIAHIKALRRQVSIEPALIQFKKE